MSPKTNQDTGERTVRNRKEERVAALVEFLRIRPDARKGEMARVIGLNVKSLPPYLKAAGERDFTVTQLQTRSGIQEFLVFIATTYQGNDSAPEYNYQEDIIDEIDERLETHASRYPTMTAIKADTRIIFGADWDIMLRLFARRFDSVSRFVVEQIRTCKNVARTHTTWSVPLPERRRKGSKKAR